MSEQRNKLKADMCNETNKTTQESSDIPTFHCLQSLMTLHFSQFLLSSEKELAKTKKFKESLMTTAVLQCLLRNKKINNP